jgi:[ribosomal protein S5]-alanine N-acetyltransferase
VHAGAADVPLVGVTAAATRLVSDGDAGALATLLADNRAFLAPWEPVRPDDYFTVSGQAAVIRDALTLHTQGRALPHVILDGDRNVVGRITLNGIVRGAFQSCSVGYWVGEAHNGKGYAGAALRDVMTLAFHSLGLHRIQAETLVHNVASQKVLVRNGFVRYGLAPSYLNIAGAWQDHVMYQVVNDPR